MDGILNRTRGGEPAAGSRSDLVGPDPADMYSADATALMAQRRYAEAEPLLREALRLRPDCPSLLNKLGSCLWEQGWPSKAEPLFARAVELSPHDSVSGIIWAWRCGIRAGRPRPPSAIARRSQLNPDAIDVRMNLGVVLSDLGRFDEAIGHLREAVRRDPAIARYAPEPRHDAGPDGPLDRGPRLL